ncbi:hypothetical protein F3Y22_tig00110013pilonHSYRG00235 [Hibiscus syriacus]|uniref:Uncharacterized protein n=1 Tax=Hibiscus syriacus TaxID=106335 RepID=A0A6A3BQV8_HIBSY|nr:hypothetical protein F3Y22_tig00110013pilonHSYRG00235 [Hibiscus syriacus]
MYLPQWFPRIEKNSSCHKCIGIPTMEQLKKAIGIASSSIILDRDVELFKLLLGNRLDTVLMFSIPVYLLVHIRIPSSAHNFSVGSDISYPKIAAIRRFVHPIQCFPPSQLLLLLSLLASISFTVFAWKLSLRNKNHSPIYFCIVHPGDCTFQVFMRCKPNKGESGQFIFWFPISKRDENPGYFLVMIEDLPQGSSRHSFAHIVYERCALKLGVRRRRALSGWNPLSLSYFLSPFGSLN